MDDDTQYKLNWDHFMTIFEPFYITDKRKKVFEMLEASNKKILDAVNTKVGNVVVGKVVKLVEDVNEKINEIPSETISPSVLSETDIIANEEIVVATSSFGTIVCQYLLDVFSYTTDASHISLAMGILVCAYVFYKIIRVHSKRFFDPNCSDSESELDFEDKPAIQDFEHPIELTTNCDSNRQVTSIPQHNNSLSTAQYSESLTESECTSMSIPQPRFGRRRQRAASDSKRFTAAMKYLVECNGDSVSEQDKCTCTCSTGLVLNNKDIKKSCIGSDNTDNVKQLTTVQSNELDCLIDESCFTSECEGHHSALSETVIDDDKIDIQVIYPDTDTDDGNTHEKSTNKVAISLEQSCLNSEIDKDKLPEQDTHVRAQLNKETVEIRTSHVIPIIDDAPVNELKLSEISYCSEQSFCNSEIDQNKDKSSEIETDSKEKLDHFEIGASSAISTSYDDHDVELQLNEISYCSDQLNYEIEKDNSSETESEEKSQVDDDYVNIRTCSPIPNTDDSSIQQLPAINTHDTDQISESLNPSSSHVNNNHDTTILASHEGVNDVDQIEINICSRAVDQVPMDDEKAPSHEICTQTSFFESDHGMEKAPIDNLDKECDKAVQDISSVEQQIITNSNEKSSNSSQSDTSIMFKDIKLALAANCNTQTEKSHVLSRISNLLFNQFSLPDTRETVTSTSTDQPNHRSNEDDEVENINKQEKSSVGYCHSFRPLNTNESPLNSSSHDGTDDDADREIAGNSECNPISTVVNPAINQLQNFSTTKLLEKLPPLNEMKFVENTSTNIKYDGSFTSLGIELPIISEIQSTDNAILAGSPDIRPTNYPLSSNSLSSSFSESNSDICKSTSEIQLDCVNPNSGKLSKRVITLSELKTRSSYNLKSEASVSISKDNITSRNERNSNIIPAPFLKLPGQTVGGNNQREMPIEEIRNLSPTLDNGIRIYRFFNNLLFPVTEIIDEGLPDFIKEDLISSETNDTKWSTFNDSYKQQSQEEGEGVFILMDENGNSINNIMHEMANSEHNVFEVSIADQSMGEQVDIGQVSESNIDSYLRSIHSSESAENGHPDDRIIKYDASELKVGQSSANLYSRLEEFTQWGRVFGFNSSRIPTTTTLPDVTDAVDDDGAATEFDITEFDDPISSDLNDEAHDHDISGDFTDDTNNELYVSCPAAEDTDCLTPRLKGLTGQSVPSSKKEEQEDYYDDERDDQFFSMDSIELPPISTVQANNSSIDRATNIVEENKEAHLSAVPSEEDTHYSDISWDIENDLSFGMMSFKDCKVDNCLHPMTKKGMLRDDMNPMVSLYDEKHVYFNENIQYEHRVSNEESDESLINREMSVTPNSEITVNPLCSTVGDIMTNAVGKVDELAEVAPIAMDKLTGTVNRTSDTNSHDSIIENCSRCSCSEVNNECCRGCTTDSARTCDCSACNLSSDRDSRETSKDCSEVSQILSKSSSLNLHNSALSRQPISSVSNLIKKDCLGITYSEVSNNDPKQSSNCTISSHSPAFNNVSYCFPCNSPSCTSNQPLNKTSTDTSSFKSSVISSASNQNSDPALSNASACNTSLDSDYASNHTPYEATSPPISLSCTSNQPFKSVPNNSENISNDVHHQTSIHSLSEGQSNPNTSYYLARNIDINISIHSRESEVDDYEDNTSQFITQLLSSETSCHNKSTKDTSEISKIHPDNRN